MPSVTSPQTVYWPLRNEASSKQMKNWLSPEFGILRARHRDRAATVRLAVELGLELLAGAAGAGAVRTAGLRHEAVDDAMEDDAVVEAVAHQFLDPRHVARREVGPHRDHHLALGGLQHHRVFGFSHCLFLFECRAGYCRSDRMTHHLVIVAFLTKSSRGKFLAR